MKSRFFLPCVAPDVARIAHAHPVDFLEPLVQLILVLILSVAAKNNSQRKRSWGCMHTMLQNGCVGKVNDVVTIPGVGKVPKVCLGVFSRTDVLVSPCHAEMNAV